MPEKLINPSLYQEQVALAESSWHIRDSNPVYLFVLLLLVQFAGPVLKATHFAFAHSSWWVVTSLLWGPWLLTLVLAVLGWLLYLAGPRNQP